MSHDRWAQMDAAYLLHALDEEEAAAFEAHAAGCDACRASVEELRAVLPYLIGSDEELLEVEMEFPPPPTLLPRLIEEAGRVRRRRALRAAAGAAAAAGLGAAAAVLAFAVLPAGGPGTGGPDESGTTAARAMVPLRPVPVRATAALQSTPWGTRVTVHCRYAGSGIPAGGYAYGLVVRASDGTTRRLGTWTLMPDHDLTFTSGTALPRADIEAIDITTTDGARLLELRN